MKLGQMKYRGTIAVGMDGVLANFEKKFCEDFGTANRNLYSLEARYPELDPQLIREFANSPDNYRDLEPIFGGILFCHQAKARGWYVLIVTSRDWSLREVTKSWLAKYNVDYNEILFTRNKQEALEDYDNLHPTRKVAIVVDDSVSVLESMPERYCVAWTQEWNYGYYPNMWYDSKNMKILLRQYQDDFYPKGIWDKVGK